MLEVRFQSELFSDAQATRPLQPLLDLRLSLDSYFPNPVLLGNQGSPVSLPPTAVGATRGCLGPLGPESLLHWIPGGGRRDGEPSGRGGVPIGSFWKTSLVNFQRQRPDT